MAEGIEESESNNNGSGEQVVMLGAVMPCEMASPNLGGLKRELEIIPATAATTAISSPGVITTPIPQQHLHQQQQQQQQQQHPINLKSEFFDENMREIDRDTGSPSNSPARPISRCSNNNENPYTSHGLKNSSTITSSSPPQNSTATNDHHAKNAAAAAAVAAQAHFNGTMQGMLNLQKLQQNIASMQQQHQPTMPSLAGLQGLAGLSPASLNSPLNLSIGSGPGGLGSAINAVSGLNLNGNQMPQLILASGQLVQGIQGAQLLIPTPQGIATQTILTIPVSQQMSSGDQLVQSLAAMNGIAASAAGNPSQINLGSIHHPNQGPSLLSPHLLSSSVQQLLAAIQPQIFPSHDHQAQPTSQPTHTSASSSSLHSNQQTRTSPTHSTSSLIGGHSRVLTPKSSPPRNASASSMSSLGSSSQHHHTGGSDRHTDRHHPYEKNSTATSQTQVRSSQDSVFPQNGHGRLSVSPIHHNPHQNQTQMDHRQSHQHHQPHQSHHLSNRAHSPTSMAINNINRLAATNGELTITKSHGPSPSLGSSSSSSNHHQNGPQHVSQMKMSPSSMKMSPIESEDEEEDDDHSRNDLLDDNPNEPTINQTNCNVVDGIDLDEIKEFAKAFKLRRLSLGLTQTQVGQALSVTEGPAYSQSAICSALAAQMYAAQLSSQQQAMFEKLDITPKSAQKIKPVLERWMKEAEERYKSGQNHLTDFIGVEPSKKRKRRTSFTPQALELLNAHFERNTHPSGTEITGLAHQLGYEREVIRIWFCNKRQALKNTVRMMSKGMV